MSKSRIRLAFVLLFPFLTLEVVAQQPHPLGSLEIIDATGKKVGTVIGLNDFGFEGARMGPFPQATVELNGRVLPINIARDLLFGTTALFFTSTDCSGNPLIPPSGSPIATTSIHTPQRTLYMDDPDATPMNTVINSTLGSDGSCFSGNGFDSVVVPAIQLIDLAEIFTPPFRVVVETVISLVIPSSAPSGTRIKLVGKGFSVGDVEVLFNGIAGVSVEVLNDTTLLVTVPGLAPGPVDITVNTAGGTATLPGEPGGFEVAVLTAAIPTLFEWGLGLLMIGLICAGIHHLRAKRIEGMG